MKYSKTRRKELEFALSRFSKVDLLNLPTPFQRLENFKASVDSNLYIKRDDLSGLALGGNKSRRYEYLFNYLREQKYDSIIHCVNVLSNDAVQIACAANKLNIELHLIVKSNNPQKTSISGNLLLSYLSGCNVYIVNEYYAKDFFCILKKKLENDRNLFVIETGIKGYSINKYNFYGSLSYIFCFLEILDQASDLDIDTIILESGGVSQAGLLFGASYLNCNLEIIGNDPSEFNFSKRESFISELLDQMSSALDLKVPKILEIHQSNNFGKGYGKIDKETLENIKLLAMSDGIFLDPVYTAKSFSLVKKSESKGLIYIHTGGAGNIFNFDKIITSKLDNNKFIRIQTPLKYRFNRLKSRLINFFG